MTDAITRAPLTLQMSFLALDGMNKAPVYPSRLFWPGLPVAGGVVRLSTDDQVETGLAITEGLEDAKSIIDHGMEPVWACLSAGSIANFPVLGGIEALTICADADDAGQRAATKCMERWRAAGREVTIAFPIGGAKD
ncbi:MAG: toprim domain-containing protein, partial [Proteobacteria bacterium]|nr:toprim domain-containing protein [Pseudomonadota bacterium]